MTTLNEWRVAPGDTIGVVSPGFAVRRADLESGCRALERMGFGVRLGRHVLARHGYLAGSDDQRAADLEEMMFDDSVDAVWFARGGYGTARLLPRLRRLPSKLLIGYSDATALFSAMMRRDDEARCLYAPVVTELGQSRNYHRASLRVGLSAKRSEIRVLRRDVLREGSCAGRLMGGNLSVLASLCGTPYLPRFKDAVLFLEDVGEPLYALDRMLGQLAQAGCFRGVRGVLLGAFDPPRRRRFPPDRDPAEVLTESFVDAAIPIVAGLPVGHVAGKRTLPFGATARIETADRRVILEP